MVRMFCAITAVAALSGCLQVAPSGGGSSASAPAVAVSDGEAKKLKVGMSPNDAFLTFGPESGFERNPANWDQSCLSYPYGPAEAPKYVHAVFVNDVLTSATDGHPAICTYSEPDAGA